MQEKSQPDAFALPVKADQIHAVVPVAGTHQRQTVLAKSQAVHDGAHAMLVQTSAVRTERASRSRIPRRADLAAFEETNGFIQYTGVARRRDIAAGDEGSHR